MSSRRRRIFANPRILILLGAAVTLLGLFMLRLWDIQVVHGAEYRNRAVNNRLRLDTIDAPRGIIYDRNGQPLVYNAPNFEVQIIPAYLPDDEKAEMAVYDRLSKLLNMPIEANPVLTDVVPMGHGALSVIDGMKYLYDRTEANVNARGCCLKTIVDEVRGIAPYEPVIISQTVSRPIALQIAEEAYDLPGVRVYAAPVREYLSGTVTSGILGYLRRISENDLAYLPQDVYNADTDRIGATGIEGQFEDVLRGQKGRRTVEEDVVGREIGVVGPVQSPVPGDNLQLTIDLDLQSFSQQALQGEIDALNRYYNRTVTQRGAVIVMDLKTGEILAMVSLPTYDNNIFSRPVIKPEELDAISKDPYLPQINHAFQSAFAPGSTFKIVLAAAALQEKVITPRTTIFDPGVISIPNEYFPDDPRLAQKFYGWYLPGFGDQNVVDALAHSANVFFYEIGGGYHVKGQPTFEGLGITRLKQYSEAFGFGSPTGIDLVGESAGFVPDAVWKRHTIAENWTVGDTYNFSIGQGFLTATPLQVLNAYAAIANDGVLMQPHVVKRIMDAEGTPVKTFSPQVIRQVPIDANNLQIVRLGLDAVVNSDTGTGYKYAHLDNVRVAGKTGTAEYCDDMALKNGECYTGHQPTHAWFAAYAPYDHPEIAIVVFLYNGGQGSETAAPVARQILQYYFERKNQPPATQTGQAATP